jgi:hypothetical protein
MMTRVVYKYPLGGPKCSILLPLGAQILTVAMQGENAFLWALVDIDEPEKEEWSFEVFGTGHPVSKTAGDHFGTLFNGPFVWHVFGGVK